MKYILMFLFVFVFLGFSSVSYSQTGLKFIGTDSSIREQATYDHSDTIVGTVFYKKGNDIVSSPATKIDAVYNELWKFRVKVGNDSVWRIFQRQAVISSSILRDTKDDLGKWYKFKPADDKKQSQEMLGRRRGQLKETTIVNGSSDDSSKTTIKTKN